MASIKIKDVTDFLESWAPRSYQESYDNSGLLAGNYSSEVKGILVSLDCTEEVVAEAIQAGCNMIVAHHPIIFKGLKKLTGSNYIERTIILAIKNDIAIYAIHTNLDNIHTGVNYKIAEKLGLKDLRILLPKTDTLQKLVTFIPKTKVAEVLSAMHLAGAGQIGKYKNCSFGVDGIGSYLPTSLANPTIGSINQQESVEETRVEVILPSHLSGRIINSLKLSHPYEEVAYYLTNLNNENQEVGSGMIGELDKPIEPSAFLLGLKTSMNLSVIRHTKLIEKPIKKVAIAGGSGSFLLPKAIQAQADIFITADFKYHEFFDADGQIIIVDIGHYESEVFTKDLLVGVLMEKFPTFAINFSKTITNPISYF
ncbi:MAG TPA: Nif3-like dinuclear metal center hexameric protein [Chryseolinea sp.]|nr:Nif3-like dinuclear metal center hexameric protein [Chryseolinea sp.]